MAELVGNCVCQSCKCSTSERQLEPPMYRNALGASLNLIEVSIADTERGARRPAARRSPRRNGMVCTCTKSPGWDRYHSSRGTGIGGAAGTSPISSRLTVRSGRLRPVLRRPEKEAQDIQRVGHH